MRADVNIRDVPSSTNGPAVNNFKLHALEGLTIDAPESGQVSPTIHFLYSPVNIVPIQQDDTSRSRSKP